MKAKVLISYYPLESGHTAHRVYLEPDFEQAEADLKLVLACGYKSWELQDCELFGNFERVKK